MGKVAGLLQYCIGNNYQSGDGADSVEDQPMSKLSSLGGSGGLKGELTKKACGTILTQAKSFL